MGQMAGVGMLAKDGRALAEKPEGHGEGHLRLPRRLTQRHTCGWRGQASWCLSGQEGQEDTGQGAATACLMDKQDGWTVKVGKSGGSHDRKHENTKDKEGPFPESRKKQVMSLSLRMDVITWTHQE